jgi:hypothetical protein
VDDWFAGTSNHAPAPVPGRYNNSAAPGQPAKRSNDGKDDPYFRYIEQNIRLGAW